MIDMARKYYGVQRIVDSDTNQTIDEPTIYHNWPDCQRAVSGRHAIYKSFETEEEAWDFALADERTNREIESDNHMIAYVDGSSSAKAKELGVGIVYQHDGKDHEIAFHGNDPIIIRYLNAASEVYSATYAIMKAIELKVDEVHIYHDHQGLASWANGLWKTNNDLTRAYARYVDQARDNGLRIVFHKVKGHTGDVLNERADDLARDGRKHGEKETEQEVLIELGLKGTKNAPKFVEGDWVLISNDQNLIHEGTVIEQTDNGVVVQSHGMFEEVYRYSPFELRFKYKREPDSSITQIDHMLEKIESMRRENETYFQAIDNNLEKIKAHQEEIERLRNEE